MTSVKETYLSSLRASLMNALPKNFVVTSPDNVTYSELVCTNRYLVTTDVHSVRCDISIRKSYTKEVSSSFPWVTFLFRDEGEDLHSFISRLTELRRTQAVWIIEVDLKNAELRIHEKCGVMSGLSFGEVLRLSEIGVSFVMPELPSMKLPGEGEARGSRQKKKSTRK